MPYDAYLERLKGGPFASRRDALMPLGEPLDKGDLTLGGAIIERLCCLSDHERRDLLWINMELRVAHNPADAEEKASRMWPFAISSADVAGVKAIHAGFFANPSAWEEMTQAGWVTLTDIVEWTHQRYAWPRFFVYVPCPPDGSQSWISQFLCSPENRQLDVAVIYPTSSNFLLALLGPDREIVQHDVNQEVGMGSRDFRHFHGWLREGPPTDLRQRIAAYIGIDPTIRSLEHHEHARLWAATELLPKRNMLTWLAYFADFFHYYYGKTLENSINPPLDVLLHSLTDVTLHAEGRACAPEFANAVLRFLGSPKQTSAGTHEEMEEAFAPFIKALGLGSFEDLRNQGLRPLGGRGSAFQKEGGERLTVLGGVLVVLGQIAARHGLAKALSCVRRVDSRDSWYVLPRQKLEEAIRSVKAFVAVVSSVTVDRGDRSRCPIIGIDAGEEGISLQTDIPTGAGNGPADYLRHKVYSSLCKVRSPDPTESAEGHDLSDAIARFQASVSRCEMSEQWREGQFFPSGAGLTCEDSAGRLILRFKRCVL